MRLQLPVHTRVPFRQQLVVGATTGLEREKHSHRRKDTGAHLSRQGISHGGPDRLRHAPSLAKCNTFCNTLAPSPSKGKFVDLYVMHALERRDPGVFRVV